MLEEGRKGMLTRIENYINGDDYPDEIPNRIMGLFDRKRTLNIRKMKDKSVLGLRQNHGKKDICFWIYANMTREQIVEMLEFWIDIPRGSKITVTKKEVKK